MFDWLFNMLGSIGDVVKDIVTYLQMFADNLEDAITTVNNMSSGGVIADSLGTFKYVVGDLIYNIYFYIMLMGLCWTLYLLVKKLISEVVGTISKSNIFGSIKNFISGGV